MEQKPSIMVVNDDPVSARELTTELARAGYGSVIGGTVETAIDIAEQRHPAIILINIQHRAKGGLLLAVTLRIKAETSAIPIVVMSPFPEHRLLGSLLSNFGIEAAIGEPFSPGDAVEFVTARLQQADHQAPAPDEGVPGRTIPGESEKIPVTQNNSD